MTGSAASTGVPFARLRGRVWHAASTRPPRRSPGRLRDHVGSWPAHGVLVGAVTYTLPAPKLRVPQLPAALPTATGPRFSTPDTSPEAPNAGSNRRCHPSGLGNQVRALMPTPQAKLGHAGPDYARAARPGSGGDDLTTVVAKAVLLPTPTARDDKGANQRGDRTCLTGALLPTPRASDATKGSPHQHGSAGDLTLPSAVHLLPTPTAADARSSAVQTVQHPGRPIPAGSLTLTDAARLLPTPSAADALGGHHSRSGRRRAELLLPGIAQTLTTPRHTARLESDAAGRS